MAALLLLATVLSCDNPTDCLCGNLVGPDVAITISVDPLEGGSTSKSSGTYPDKSGVTATAIPKPGYTFVNWTSGTAVIGTSPTATFQASAGLSVVAHFSSGIEYVVTVTGAGMGTGTVIGPDSAINCVVTVGVASGSCMARYQTSTTVVLTTTPAPGNAFGAWSGACSVKLAADTTRVPSGGCALASTPLGTPASNQTVTAMFVPTGNYMMTTRVRTGDSGSTANAAFPAGSTASVVATPAPGWAFLYWTNVPGGIASGDPVYSFTATMSRLLEGAFTNSPIRYAISATSNPPTGGTVADTGIVPNGRYVALVATPAKGYAFSNWMDASGSVIGTTAGYPGFLASSDRSFTANFLPTDGTFTLSVGPTGAGGGRVTSAPGMINCAWSAGTATGPCVANYAAGSVVVLTAAANAQSGFSGWTGACSGLGSCILTMSGNRSVGAAFLPSDAPLNLTIDGLYLTQAVQNYAGTVALVTNRDALLRVFVKASGQNGAAPLVRARLYENGTLFATHTLPAPAAGVPTSIDEGALSSSWNLLLPASEIRPGLSILADVDPDGLIAESNDGDNSYPVKGVPLALDVRTPSSFDVTFVPVGRAGVFLLPDMSPSPKRAGICHPQPPYGRLASRHSASMHRTPSVETHSSIASTRPRRVWCPSWPPCVPWRDRTPTITAYSR